MNAHEYYDLLVKTSLEGGFPAIENYQCGYRTASGRRCAVGLILPDSLYSPDMEGELCLEVCKTAGTDWLPDGVRYEDLAKIQDIHDTKSSRQPWDHHRFVAELAAVPCFSGFTPKE